MPDRKVYPSKAKLHAPESMRGAVGLCMNTYDYAYSSAAFYEMGKWNNPLLRDYKEFMEVLLELEEREWEEHKR